MYSSVVIAVRTWWFLFCRMANRDKGKRYDMIRYFQQFPESGDTLFARIYADPDTAEAEGMDSNKEVLSGSGTVLHPIPNVFFKRGVPANKDCDLGFSAHQGVGMKLRDTVKDFSVIDDHNMPGLLVAGRGRAHGSFKYFLYRLVRNGLCSIFADASSGE